MASLLKSTLNTRNILKDSMRYIRSDVPVRTDKEDIEFLISNDISTLIDLRTPEEAEKKPCALARNAAFTYINIPVANGSDVPETPDLVSVSYIKMVDDTMKKIIRTIENSKGNVMYFCSAGKDRTGVVSALLLKRMGISDNEIIGDYLMSAENLREMLASFAENCPVVDLNVITPQRRYMEEFLEWLKAQEKYTF